MEDITNTTHGIRASFGGDFKNKGLRGLLSAPLYSPHSHQATDCEASQGSDSHQTFRGHTCFKGVQLELSKREAETSATVQVVGTSHLSQENSFRAHTESGDVPSLGNSIVLQDAAVRLNSVTRSLELEESRLQDTANIFPFFEKKLGDLEKAVDDLQQERDLLVDEVYRLRADAVQHSETAVPQIVDFGACSAEMMQRVQALCSDLIRAAGVRGQDGSEDGVCGDAEPPVPHKPQFYRAVAKTFAKQVISFAKDFRTADQGTLLEDLKRFDFWAENQVKPFLQQE